jgi:hypothetical protein
MFNVLLILLHRPFVSEGHLHSISPSIPANSFVVCALAATRIVQLLRIYAQTFSIRHAPSLIAYATYVSATIHVRIAAQLAPGSEAYTSLRTCLSVLNKNQETNWAARRAQTVIIKLMKKMKIELQEDENLTPQASNDPATSNEQQDLHRAESAQAVNAGETSQIGPAFLRSSNLYQDLDMDAIIGSFIHQQGGQATNMEGQDQYQRFQPPGYPGQNMQSSIQDDGFGQNWQMLDFPVDGSLSVDDMLFGFNGAALDGIW